MGLADVLKAFLTCPCRNTSQWLIFLADEGTLILLRFGHPTFIQFVFLEYLEIAGGKPISLIGEMSVFFRCASPLLSPTHDEEANNGDSKERAKNVDHRRDPNLMLSVGDNLLDPPQDNDEPD